MTKLNSKKIEKDLLVGLYATEKVGIITGASANEFVDQLASISQRVNSNMTKGKSKKFDPKLASLVQFTGKRINFLGNIVEMSEPFVPSKKIFVEDDSEDSSGLSDHYVTVEISCSGKSIQTIPVSNTEILEKLKKSDSISLKFFGTVVQVPTSKFQSKPFVYIDKIVECDSLLEILNPPKEIQKKAEDVLLKNKNILSYLFDQVVIFLNVVVPESSSLADAIRGAIISAACTSDFKGKNGRAHMGIFSRPGAGKAIIEAVTRILNIHYKHITGSKVTVAALIGATTRDAKTGATASKKGYLALTDRGSIYMEDIHAIPLSKLGDIYSVLTEQMVNGYVENSTSAMTKYSAASAVNMDWNLKSQVDKTKKYTAHQDFPMPLNIISRFDMMFELSGSVAKDKGQIKEFIKSHFDATSIIDKENSQEVILFKTIIALLFEKHSQIDLTLVQDFLTNRIEAFHKANYEKYLASDEFDVAYNRMFLAVAKITAAHCRLNQRQIAQQSDAEFALEILALKFKALRRLAPNIKYSGLINASSEERQQRQIWIIKSFGGRKDVTITEICRLHCKNFYEVGERTIRRELKAFAKTTSRGHWSIPKT